MRLARLAVMNLLRKRYDMIALSLSLCLGRGFKKHCHLPIKILEGFQHRRGGIAESYTDIISKFLAERNILLAQKLYLFAPFCGRICFQKCNFYFEMCIVKSRTLCYNGNEKRKRPIRKGDCYGKKALRS